MERRTSQSLKAAKPALDASAISGGHTYGATGSPSELEPAASFATLTERDLPHTEARLDGRPPAHFTPVSGLEIVEFVEVARSPLAPEPNGPLDGPDLFSERGYHVVEWPVPQAELPPPPQLPRRELGVGAPIPGDVSPGDAAIDRASPTILLPKVSVLKLSEAERTCTDTLHIMRGGPAVSSQHPQN
ncbi:MAG: hypothetical protein KGJ86_13050 [Chloroflexota bacterium]|nr:hypothetical protein [Chloroflexota bacterium]